MMRRVHNSCPWPLVSGLHSPSWEPIPISRQSHNVRSRKPVSSLADPYAFGPGQSPLNASVRYTTRPQHIVDAHRYPAITLPWGPVDVLRCPTICDTTVTVRPIELYASRSQRPPVL